VNYPFLLPELSPVPWQRQFYGAVMERAWLPAAELLAQHRMSDAATVACPTHVRVLDVFVTEAPQEALAISGLPGADNATSAGRASAIGRLIVAHLRLAQDALARSDVRVAHHHLAGALALRARSTAHEVAWVSVLTAVAVAIGQLELPLMQTYPQVGGDPASPAPHPEDYRRTVAEHYHPALLPDLLARAHRSGASDATMDLGVRLIVRHAQWPTWRALARPAPDASYALRCAAKAVLAGEPGLAPAARDFLRAFVAGARFLEQPPTPTNDDIPFGH
jgi:hypothetical protein